MTRIWEFTDVEFYVLWQRLVRANMPRPLTFVTEIRDSNEFEQHKHEAWLRVSEMIDGELRSAIDVLARPQAYVRLRGWHDRASEDPKYMIKARAARSGAHGYLVYQKPGITSWHSSGYTVVECGPHGLAEAIAGHMPPLEAGRSGIIPLVGGQSTVQPDVESRPSMVFEEADTGIAARSAAFFDTEAERTGLIEILQNQSMFGSRGMRREILVWRDLPGDGRYTIELPSETPTATPMSRPALIAAVDAAVERMMVRVESHWEASA
ncbi:ESX secretion-associated protein EspG [Nocardia sp. XZ_19_231]|uniref:ESX secretion-associated protein EspG n=1 Tax=Nocardia sp. XZ_19_231 TaxID=2769252 RepID=UPI00188E6EED|nr:ESX secretion-associated protein EspG [Nocardia sp. XZ_19_231]